MSNPDDPIIDDVLAELEALPEHTVIIDRDEDAWQKVDGRWCSHAYFVPEPSTYLRSLAPLVVLQRPETVKVEFGTRNDSTSGRTLGEAFTLVHDDLDQAKAFAKHDPNEKLVRRRAAVPAGPWVAIP